MDLKKVIVAGLVVFAVGVGVGKFALPEKLTEITNTEKESKKETTTTTKEETRPDGTKIKETTTTTKKEDTSKKETERIVENAKPNYHVKAMAGYNFDTVKPVYGISVEKRVLVNIFVGIAATTDKQVFATVGMEF